MLLIERPELPQNNFVYRLTRVLAITASFILVFTLVTEVGLAQTERRGKYLSGQGNISPDLKTDCTNTVDRNMSMGNINVQRVPVADTKLTVQNTVEHSGYIHKTLVIDIKDKFGNTITDFDCSLQKYMHFMVIGKDLLSFDHIYPKYIGNGQFEVEVKFAQSGNYTLYINYRPKGEQEQVSAFMIDIPPIIGSTPMPIPDPNNNKYDKNFGDTRIKLNPREQDGQSAIRERYNQKIISVPRETGMVNLVFDVSSAASNQPAQDLGTFLGEKGHLVIIRKPENGNPLSKEDYIHSYALRNTPENEIHFMTHFKKDGEYQLWVQFNRDGKVVTADFRVMVKARIF